MLAFLVAGCSAEAIAPPTDGLAGGEHQRDGNPRPTNASDDIVYVRSNGGPAPLILAIDARTGQPLRTLTDGAVSADGASVYWSESTVGGTKTRVHVTDLASGTESRSFTIDGDLLPAGNPQTFSPLAGDGRLSKDGRHLALMNVPYKLNGDWFTRLAVVNTATGAVESFTEIRGQSTYGFIAFAPDGRSMYLEQYGEGATRTRVFDIPSGTLLNASGSGLVTSGFRTAAVLSSDGRWMFRLDAGRQTTNCTSTDGPACAPNAIAPYLVAMDLTARVSTIVALPSAQMSTDFEKYMLWSLAITSDGSTLYAVNPALGVIDEFDAHALRIRRTAAITIARTGDDVLAAAARFFLPVAYAKRYLIGGAVLSPDGRTLYAAAHDGLAVIDTQSLRSPALSQPSHQFDTMRLSGDGQRLYAMDNMAGTLVFIDTTTGASLGGVKLGYVPAIIRIESGR